MKNKTKSLLKEAEQRSSLNELLTDSFIKENTNKANSQLIFVSLVKFILDEVRNESI